MVLVVGSFCVPIEKVLLDVHQLRVLQFTLKSYGVACSHVHESLALVTDKDHDVHSLDDPLLKVNVGAVVSILNDLDHVLDFNPGPSNDHHSTVQVLLQFVEQ
jgi:hypothetical protein